MVAFDDNGKIDILGLLPDELEAEILKLGEKKFRAGQIFDWLHVKRVSSFDEIWAKKNSEQSKYLNGYIVKK